MKFRIGNIRLATAAILLLLSAGCSPLLPLVSAALGTLDGGGGKSLARGPFAGGPSAVQNSRPTEAAPTRDPLAGLDQRVKSSCQAMLPPPDAAPIVGCAMRDICLPGGERPLRMRVCAAANSDVVVTLPENRHQDWYWAPELLAVTAVER